MEFLGEDWLANTADPTPIFSLLVAATLRLFNSEALFFVYYAMLMGIYFFSLFGIISQIFHLRSRRLTTGLLITAIIVLHSTVFRYLLQRLFGGDWPYLFEGGVAGQRLLGPVFQPSSFGVFLLLSVYLYLTDKKSLAVLSAALAATFHPTYLLSAAALTLAYLIDTVPGPEKDRPRSQAGNPCIHRGRADIDLYLFPILGRGPRGGRDGARHPGQHPHPTPCGRGRLVQCDGIGQASRSWLWVWS